MVFEYCDHTVLNELEAHPRGYALHSPIIALWPTGSTRIDDIMMMTMTVVISCFACQLFVQHFLYM